MTPRHHQRAPHPRQNHRDVAVDRELDRRAQEEARQALERALQPQSAHLLERNDLEVAEERFTVHVVDDHVWELHSSRLRHTELLRAMLPGVGDAIQHAPSFHALPLSADDVSVPVVHQVDLLVRDHEVAHSRE